MGWSLLSSQAISNEGPCHMDKLIQQNIGIESCLISGKQVLE